MIATIFDIDGTLVESYNFDGECYITAVKEVLGDVHIYDDWSDYKKVTDLGILLQIMEENGIRDLKCVEKVRDRFGELTQLYLKNGGKCYPKKGAIDLIESLLSDDRFRIGFATGGWGHTAKMKLQYAGFNLGGIDIFSSDDGDDRVEIMRKCLQRLGDSFDRIVYIGDAEWDLQDSKDLNWDFIGVGARLKGKCDVWVEDYSNYEAFSNLLFA